MDGLLGSFQLVIGIQTKRNNDAFDRLSSKYTALLLVGCAGLLTLFRIGDNYPIKCWFPAHFHSSHKKFGNAYCWISNTYYLPHEEHIPGTKEGNWSIAYYQWVPMILLVQALLFRMPAFFWDSLKTRAGIDIDHVMASARRLNDTAHVERREVITDLLAMQLNRVFSARRRCHDADNKCKTFWRNFCDKRYGAYLTVLYLVTKALYTANIAGQLFALEWLFNFRYTAYGFRLDDETISDNGWQHSPGVAFPRVTMCDIDVRRLGGVQRYTVQCTLTLNFVYEKIYLGLWFWLVALLGSTIAGFVLWLVRCAPAAARTSYLHSLLDLKAGDELGYACRTHEFVDSYLKEDGVLMLRLIDHNTNNITAREIAVRLWEVWLEKGQETEMADGRVL